MNKLSTFIVSIATILAMGSVSAMAAGDASKGEKVFKKCAVCHSLDAGPPPKGKKKKIGPHLVGLFGRAAGTIDGYEYSDAMKGSKIVWDEETLNAYLANPRQYVKGSRMIFRGLKNQQDREDVIAYLKEATQ